VNNYHYIIASLPHLGKGSEDASFDLAKIREEIESQCSAKDVETIAFFCKMLDGTSLDKAYYDTALKSHSNLTRHYSNLDRQIRNMKVRMTAKALYDSQTSEELISKYVIEDEVDPYAEYKEPSKLDADFTREDQQELSAIFADADIVSKEKKLDDYKWDKIDSLTTFDYFNIDCILAFLAKGHLVSRWLKLDTARGKHLFRKLVDEVRGTYDNNKLKYAIDENNG